jgi:poly(3-hydroxybutyrate) depolymerase
MYEAYQAHADWMWPLRTFAKNTLPLLRNGPHAGWGDSDPQRRFAALLQLIKLGEVTHHRPPFGLSSAVVKGEPVAIEEEAAHVTPFATLLHFRKVLPPGTPAQPRVLVVAPMSGHFATLLRDTVETMLPHHDVYITDWHNARDVPLASGRFGLDEYTEHLMVFLRVIGPGAHLMAICQPCVAALSAVALMSEDGDPATPASLTLMAGPIDCRISPTEVNKLAMTRGIDWFEQNLVSRVPWRFKGGGRRVYPGFMQLTAFMAMNQERHIEAFKEYYANLAADPDEEKLQKAEHTRRFYEEYFAVADLPAEFYLETVSLVFQEYALPQGRLKFRGRNINPAAIRRTALLTVEGERDDICSTGQTLAAQDLCTNLRPYMRTHYVQAGVGHYGVFSGRRWRSQIYPVVRDVIHVSG